MSAQRALIGIKRRSVFRPARLLLEASTDRGRARLGAWPTILLVGSTGSIRRDGCHDTRRAWKPPDASSQERERIAERVRAPAQGVRLGRPRRAADVAAVRERRANGGRSEERRVGKDGR